LNKPSQNRRKFTKKRVAHFYLLIVEDEGRKKRRRTGVSSPKEETEKRVLKFGRESTRIPSVQSILGGKPSAVSM